MTDSDSTRPVTPRTEAGRRLAARAKREAWGNWEGIARFEIPAIEREAAAPATEALRARIAALADIPFEPGPYTDGWRDAVKDALYWIDKAALASPEPTPATGLSAEALRAEIRGMLADLLVTLDAPNPRLALQTAIESIDYRLAHFEYIAAREES